MFLITTFFTDEQKKTNVYISYHIKYEDALSRYTWFITNKLNQLNERCEVVNKIVDDIENCYNDDKYCDKKNNCSRWDKCNDCKHYINSNKFIIHFKQYNTNDNNMIYYKSYQYGNWFKTCGITLTELNIECEKKYKLFTGC